jgi:hypothetical protein
MFCTLLFLLVVCVAEAGPHLRRALGDVQGDPPDSFGRAENEPIPLEDFGNLPNSVELGLPRHIEQLKLVTKIQQRYNVDLGDFVSKDFIRGIVPLADPTSPTAVRFKKALPPKGVAQVQMEDFMQALNKLEKEGDGAPGGGKEDQVVAEVAAEVIDQYCASRGLSPADCDTLRAAEREKVGEPTASPSPAPPPTPPPPTTAAPHATTPAPAAAGALASSAIPYHLAFQNRYGDKEFVWGEWTAKLKPNFRVGQLGNGVMEYFKQRLISLQRGAKKFGPLHQKMEGVPHGVGAVFRSFQDLLPDEVHYSLKQRRRFPQGPKWDKYAEVCQTIAVQHRGYMCNAMLGLDTIADDCERAMDGYLKVKDRQLFPLKQNDAVIHFRCGDVVLPTNIQYGIPSFEYYVSSIPATAQRVLIVGNFESKKSGISHSGIDKMGDERCAAIAKRLPAYITEKTGKPALVVSSLPSSGVNRDFILAARAPTLIGSISTFSLMAALCNKHGQSVLPASALLVGRSWQGKLAEVPAFGRVTFKAISHGLVADNWDPDSTLLSAKRTTAQVLQSLEKGEGDWDGFKDRRRLLRQR